MNKVNEWIEKSIDVANSEGYLDRLLDIYLPPPSPERTLPSEVEKAIRDAVYKKQEKQLIKILLREVEKFPIEHPFIGCLKENEALIDKNPRVVRILAEQLFAIGAEEIIKGCKQPKKISRRLGGMFQKWIEDKLGYPVFYSTDKFEAATDVALMGGSDEKRKEYANKRLGCAVEEKGLDLLVKVNNKFIIGQAKFITTPGGAQDNQFSEAIRFVDTNKGNATRVAILDGVVWFNRGYLEKIKRANKNILTALLLKDFIESMRF